MASNTTTPGLPPHLASAKLPTSSNITGTWGGSSSSTSPPRRFLQGLDKVAKVASVAAEAPLSPRLGWLLPLNARLPPARRLKQQQVEPTASAGLANEGATHHRIIVRIDDMLGLARSHAHVWQDFRTMYKSASLCPPHWCAMLKLWRAFAAKFRAAWQRAAAVAAVLDRKDSLEAGGDSDDSGRSLGRRTTGPIAVHKNGLRPRMQRKFWEHATKTQTGQCRTNLNK